MKHDIVYFVKECPNNEELRYSIRSVVENFPYNKIWFYGGCPMTLQPDAMVHIEQRAPRKWENVQNMMLEACYNDSITEDFWLFNDDFFIIEPMQNGIEPRYDGTITSKIKEVEDAHMGERQEWTNNLRHLRESLQKDGNPEQNYAIHEPLLVNRRKMREVLEKYPNEPMVRALYGNYWRIGGVQDPDPKLAHQHYAGLDDMLAGMDVVSTSDESFHHGNVGEWLRKRFDNKSKYEKE